MRTILSSVYENLKRTVGPHNTSSYQVASTQAASTLPSQPAIQPPLEPIAQHPTLQDSTKAASTTPSQPAVQPPQAPSAQHSTLQDNTLKPVCARITIAPFFLQMTNDMTVGSGECSCTYCGGSVGSASSTDGARNIEENKGDS